MAEPSFWSAAKFQTADALNADLWTRSPQLQLEIQGPETLQKPGVFGPQQAMLEPDEQLAVTNKTVLPWVPALVGREADTETGVFIIGAAYAGFIAEYSTRKAGMSLRKYVAAMRSGGWSEFQEQFLEHVVIPDRDYYGKLAALLRASDIAPERVALSDLCPNSLVTRRGHKGQRQDDSKQPSGLNGQVFRRYVEHPEVEGWLWKRISGSSSGRILALGQLAEHGILRMFHRQGAAIHCSGQPLTLVGGPAGSPEECWVDAYADPAKKLGYWLEPGRWWTITRAGREWRLLPIYHPASVHNYDPGYGRTTVCVEGWL